MTDTRVPSKNTDSDTYLDVQEVLWKDVVADAYRQVKRILEKAIHLEDAVLCDLQLRFVDIYNRNHEKYVFDNKFEVIRRKLLARLRQIGCDDACDQIQAVVATANERIRVMLSTINCTDLRHQRTNQTFIRDGLIEIAGKDIEVFATQSDYFTATLQLMGELNEDVVEIARKGFERGFAIRNDELQVIVRGRLEEWDATDVLTSILLLHQVKERCPSIAMFEHDPNLSLALNRARKLNAIEEAYFLVGKIMIAIAAFTPDHISTELMPTPDLDPIRSLLTLAGKNPTNAEITAVRTVALGHCSHGLNSGELTARLAGSVRTSFPRALIASFNIRSGLLHSGAIKECMTQVKALLASNLSAADYVQGLHPKKAKFFGFGHRIHKTNETDATELLGKDPRVSLYIRAAKQGFPAKSGTIDRMIAYAEEIRKVRRSLGANTDFGAAVLFLALDLSPRIAEGFFAAFRCVGVCANVLNELQTKGNSRRPPFAEVLAYPAQTR